MNFKCVNYMNCKYVSYQLKNLDNGALFIFHEFFERQCVYYCGQIYYHKKKLNLFQKLEFKILSKIEKLLRDRIQKG